MLVGFLGGTFDPVHLGHTHVATSVLQHTSIEQVRLVLAARPGHRQAPQASVEDRWNMLRLACNHPQLIPDDIELQRSGPSYTVDTLLHIRRMRPDWIPCWILGWDAFALLHLWHRWEHVMGLCNLVVVERPGEAQALPEPVANLCQIHEKNMLSATGTGQIQRLNVPMRDVSATQVRARIQRQQPCEDLLEHSVNDYIIEHGLYEN